jgi:hypothetical protein
MTREDLIITKFIGTGSYFSIILGTITQNITLQLSAISYIVGITLGIITIFIKLYDFIKKRKNENTTNN